MSHGAVAEQSAIPLEAGGTEALPGSGLPRSKQWAFLAGALVLTTVVWVALFVERVHAHQPNVDDYLYSFLGNQIWNGHVGVLHTGQTSPLVPTLAGPFVHEYGINGGVFIQLPLLLLTEAGSYALARTWVRPLPAAVTALAVGLNQALLGYALMLHFSVAVAGAIIWSFVSYLRSDHLREWRWCLLLGVTSAVLLLSRSMTPAYLLPLIAVILFDVGLDARRRRPRRWLPAVLPVMVVLLLAGPWWLVSGHQALHYLFTAGYSASTGFSSQSGTLTPASVYQRVQWTLDELGRPESAALGIAVVAAGWGVVRRRSVLNYRGVGLLAAWVVLTVVLLASTSDNGSGFGVPIVAVAIVACGAIVGQLPLRPFKTVNTALAVMLALGFLAAGVLAEATGGSGRGWPGPPYRSEVLGAGGTQSTNLDSLASQVSRTIRNAPTVDALNDALLSDNGLRWVSLKQGLNLLYIPNSSSSTGDAIRGLRRAQFLISGSAVLPYPPPVREESVQVAAEAGGFWPVHVWRFGNETTIVIWERGLSAKERARFPLLLNTTIEKPSKGTVLTGHQFLSANVTGSLGIPLGVTRVEFRATGAEAQNLVVGTAVPFEYGWLAGWDTRAVPNGTYTLRSVVYDAAGSSASSPGVVVQVRN